LLKRVAPPILLAASGSIGSLEQCVGASPEHDIEDGEHPQGYGALDGERDTKLAKPARYVQYRV
jgi:hypothetical protein